MMNKEEGISHIAYFRTDGGSTILYTEEYVNNLQQRIDKAIEYMKPRFMNCIDNDIRYFEDNDIQEIYEILGGKE